MSLTTTEFGNALAALTADLIAGTITQAEFADGAAALFLDLIGMETSNPGLALRMGLLVSEWKEAAGLLFKGTLPSEADLPSTGNRLGDLWLIDGDIWLWTFDPEEGPTDTPTLVWVNVGRLQGETGDDGREVELQKSATHVQWRYAGEDDWVDLIALTDLKGEDGQEVALQATGSHIQWRLGAGSWQDLVALADLMGADGREVQLQKSATHIQWRYSGDAAWTDLVPLDDLKVTGDPGANGWTPIEATVADGERRVKRIVDWTGGSGTKPPTGKYIGPTGLVDTAAEATDVRGPGGAGSGDMQGSNNLSDLTDATVARTNLFVYSKSEVDGFLADKADADEVYSRTASDALLADKADAADTYTKTEVDQALGDKQDALGFTPEDVANKGRAGGYASLGGDGKVLAGQLPPISVDFDPQQALAAFEAALGA